MRQMHIGVFVLLAACHVTVAASTASVNGQWNGWSQWSSCSSPYDVRTRSRHCSNPPPSGLGQDCIGLHVDTSPCSDIYQSLVPGNWSQWNAWEACSVTCSAGIQRRSRDCIKPPQFTCQACIPTCTGDKHETQPCDTPCPSTYRDCEEIKQDDSSATTGVYSIHLSGLNKQVKVWCDMDISPNGGVTVFQKRDNRSVSFYRPMAEYINGFGTPEGDYWLGLDAIHELTSMRKQRKLMIHLIDGHRIQYNDVYENFSIDARPFYTLRLDAGSHQAGDGLTINNGCKFSTFDKDQDKQLIENCAETFHGAWWFETCGRVNLNGRIFETSTPSYYLNHKYIIPLTSSQMGLQ